LSSAAYVTRQELEELVSDLKSEIRELRREVEDDDEDAPRSFEWTCAFLKQEPKVMRRLWDSLSTRRAFDLERLFYKVRTELLSTKRRARQWNLEMSERDPRSKKTPKPLPLNERSGPMARGASTKRGRGAHEVGETNPSRLRTADTLQTTSLDLGSAAGPVTPGRPRIPSRVQ
jgi:hypothetical protein